MKRPWHCSICTCVSVYRDTRKGRGIVLYIRVCPSIETHGKAEALFYAYVCVHLWRHTERLWHCSMHACVSVYRGTRKAKTLFHTYVSVRLWRHTERSWHCFIHTCVSVYRGTQKGRGIVLCMHVCPSMGTHGKAVTLSYAYVCVRL